MIKKCKVYVFVYIYIGFDKILSCFMATQYSVKYFSCMIRFSLRLLLILVTVETKQIEEKNELKPITLWLFTIQMRNNYKDFVYKRTNYKFSDLGSMPKLINS